MNQLRAVVNGILAAVTFAAACSSLPSPTPTSTLQASPTTAPSATPAEAAEVVRTIRGLTFVAPASWHVVIPRQWTRPLGPILFLSNAPIADPCSSEFIPAECWKPLGELPSQGIVITFSTSDLVLRDAPTLLVGQAVSGICSELGGERQYGAQLQTIVLSACLRGPDFIQNDTALKRLLSSLARTS